MCLYTHMHSLQSSCMTCVNVIICKRAEELYSVCAHEDKYTGFKVVYVNIRT